MGRLLVVAFLATLLVVVATAVVLAALALRVLFLWALNGLSHGQLAFPALPSVAAPVALFLYSAGAYLLLVVPLLALLVLLSGLRTLRRHPARKYPARWDVRTKRITAVLTALDDEAAIGGAIDEVRALPEVSTVLVSENGSRDRTVAVAKAHGARVVTERERGYGHVCITGLREAVRTTDADVIVLLEGDGTFFADDLRKLVPYLEDCDMALGTRTNAELNRPGSQMDWLMAWGNLFLAFLVRLRYWDPAFLGAIQITDVGCTFRAIRRDALERILPQLTVGGMYFSPHMILIGLRNGLSVVEAPIKFRERVGVSKGAGHSRARALRIGFEMLGEILLH